MSAWDRWLATCADAMLSLGSAPARARWRTWQAAERQAPATVTMLADELDRQQADVPGVLSQRAWALERLAEFGALSETLPALSGRTDRPLTLLRECARAAARHRAEPDSETRRAAFQDAVAAWYGNREDRSP